MNCTQGKWEVTKWASHSDIHVSVNEGSYMRFICNCGNPIADTLPTNPNAEANADIIVAAVNACKSVNPDNPQAVAESIKDMHSFLKDLARAISENQERIGVGRGIILECLLAEVEGREQ